jgi:tetratricopeptide (TPR) repeat protein
LSLNPDHADVYVNLGNAFVRRGRTADAIELYRRALGIRPDNADAELNWGVALARANQLREAVVHFNRALAIDPNATEAREYLQRASRLLEQNR